MLNALAIAYLDDGRFGHSAAALDHSGKLYIRIGEQIFQISASEVNLMNRADSKTSDDFMGALPFVYEKR